MREIILIKLGEIVLKGLNKKGGSLVPAFPKIDWSKDRDYEHLTYEELLQIMKEDNNIK